MKLMFKKYLYEAFDVTNEPSFKAWFGNSKVVDSLGAPLVVYHGTTHNFSVFKNITNYESYVGNGFYFTSEPDDASHNYAGLGPDNSIKIERISDEIWNLDDFELAETLGISEDDLSIHRNNETLDDLIKEKATERVMSKQPSPNIMPCYLKIENPFYIGVYNQFFDFIQEYNEELDEYSEPSGSGSVLINALHEFLTVHNNLSREYGEIIDELSIFDSEGFHSKKFFETLKNTLSGYDLYVHDDPYQFGDFFAKLIQYAEFDGVIMDASIFKMKYADAAIHYIVFDNRQIKSIFNKNPTSNPDIQKE